MTRFHQAPHIRICWTLLALVSSVSQVIGGHQLRSNLYTEGSGVNPPFSQIRNSIQNGYNGTKIDVNNALVEGGRYRTFSIQKPLRLHTLANANIVGDFHLWSRWYQTDGKTQIFRLFPGEENVRNSRPLAARSETFDAKTGWNIAGGGEWHEWVGRFTIVKPIHAVILQIKDSDTDDWSMRLLMNAEGNISVCHRRPLPGQVKTETLIENATGESFDIRVRDNGLDYEIYMGDNQSRPFSAGQYVRNDEPGDHSLTHFRWGMYVESNEVPSEGLIFVSHASVDPKVLPMVASDLIVGWDTWTSGSQEASWTNGNATGRARESSGEWVEASEAASKDGTFGSLSGASTVVNDSNTGTHIGATSGSGSYDFTVTAGVYGLVLKQFSYDSIRKRSGSPFQWSVTTISGSISIGVTLGGGSLESILASSGPSNHDDFDLDLTVLKDHTLAPGESATFRISFSGGTVSNADQKTYLDNVAVFGTIVSAR